MLNGDGCFLDLDDPQEPVMLGSDDFEEDDEGNYILTQESDISIATCPYFF